MEKKLISTFDRGHQAESLGLKYLEQKGYQLIARNFRWKRGEADLIMAAPDAAVALIEIRSSTKASPWLRASITSRKVYHLQQTLDYFLRRYPFLSGSSRRIEVLWIEGSSIEHWTRPL